MMPPVASRQDVAEALRFSRAKVCRGQRPYAAPSARLNNLASRIEDSFANIRRDGPRRLDEGAVPYWRTFPQPLNQPIIEGARRGLLGRQLATVAQGLVDSSVGACALALALYHLGQLRRGMAAIVLGHHARHVVPAVGTVAWMLILICLL